MELTRRGLIAASLGLAACGGPSDASTEAPRPHGPTPALRRLAPFPIGVCLLTDRLADPVTAPLIARQFSQITPEWEMQMGYILQDDGSFRWDGPDRLVAWAEGNGQRVHGTSVVWHAMKPAAFTRIDGQSKFADAYHSYILAVVGRYAARVASWDAVNEPVAEDGNGLRESLWSTNLGAEDYMVRAFETAHEADPGARLFLNDYNLENLPRKRATFMRLVDRLLARGVPLGGLGSQTHVQLDTARGAIGTAIGELAGFGLPIHISELDVSFKGSRLDLRSADDKRQAQARLVGEATDAFLALPPAQRWAMTVWGARDPESNLNLPQFGGDGTDQPLLFDAEARPKPAFWALADRLQAVGRTVR